MIKNIATSFFDDLYEITAELSERSRDIILFFICFLVICSEFFVNHRFLDHNSGTITICGSAFVLLLTLFSVKKPRAVIWNKGIIYPLMAFGIGILLISLIHPIGDGYMALAVDFTIVFPMFYYVWISRGDHERLFMILSLATVISGVLSFIYSTVLAFKGELIVFWNGDIAGHSANPNVYGMIGATVFITSIYLLLEYSNKVTLLIISSIGLGMGIGYAVVSVARSAILVEMLVVASLIVFEIKKRIIGINRLKIQYKNVMIKFTTIIIISACSLMNVMYLENINDHKLNKESQQSIQSEQVVASTSHAPLVESLSAESAVAEHDWVNTVDMASSGRITIWKQYIQRFSLLGKPLGEIEEAFPSGAEIRAHNNIIDYIYRCGYIVGGLYVVYFVMTIITGIKILFSKKYTDPKFLYSVMMISMYSVYAMLEISTLPFCRCVICVYYLSMTLVSGQRSESAW